MTTTHDDNATNWRDLADQLTPKQLAEMEYCEREQVPPGLTSPQHFLNGARAMIRHNLAQSLCADIAPPADAAGDPDEWQVWGDGFGRVYTITERRDVCGEDSDTTVSVYGVQHDDGRIERKIHLDRFEELTAAQARALAAALEESASKIEGLL